MTLVRSADLVEAKELGLPVTHVNVSEVAALSDRYVRLRDELWYNVRHWFETMEVSLPTKQEEPLVEKFTHELASVDRLGQIRY